MNASASPAVNTSPERSARRLGLIVFLYVFSHSYYFVGSLRNALGSGPQDGTVRVFALLYGIAATGLLAGSLFLLFKNRHRLELARWGAGGLALVNIIGGVVFWKGPVRDLFSLLLILSPPVYPFFLFLVVPRMIKAAGTGGAKTLIEAGILAGGALIPWIAATIPEEAGAVFSTLRPALALFMTFWCALPFLVAIVTARAWPHRSSRSAVLAGASAGAAVASLYCYGMLWAQGGNRFLMAVLPPIVFAAEALGIVIALVFGRAFGRTQSASSRQGT